jgi:hypothetical protein
MDNYNYFQAQTESVAAPKKNPHRIPDRATNKKKKKKKKKKKRLCARIFGV